MGEAITIRRGDLLYGPFPADQLQGMLNAGSVVLDDDAWSEVEGRWITVRQIVGLTNRSDTESQSTAPTLDELLGNTPTNATLPLVHTADPAKQGSLANILSVVGLIAIVLGTINVAANMKAPKKPTSGEASDDVERVESDKSIR